MNPLVLLAKEAAESYIQKKRIISPSSDLSKEFLDRKSGTFVTIMKNEKLRGCIGTYLPTKENIAEEVIFNAIAAATNDYRFGPVQEEELPHLSYIIYILSKPELVRDIKELDPKRFGIIVKTMPITHANGKDIIFNDYFFSKCGLLLPDLDKVDTTERQISVACRTAGIDFTKENMLIYRFTAEKHQ